MKIIHIGRNFKGSGESELEYTIYSKPDSTLLKDSKPFFIPDFVKDLTYELNIVYRINRLGKNIAERFAHRYYDAVTVGLSLIDNGMLSELKANDAPWELSTGFDGSSVLGKFVLKEDVSAGSLNVKLEIDSHTTQRLDSADMITPIDAIIADLSRFYTLKIGDLIFVGASDNAIGSLRIGQQFKGYIQGEEVLNLKIC